MIGRQFNIAINLLLPLPDIIPGNLLCSLLEGTTYSSEVVTLEGLLARAKYENGRYQPPKKKRQPTASDQWVDWY